MLHLENEFHDFFEKIKLSVTQEERINSAVDALTNFLTDEYNLAKEDVFIQGSFSTNTVTRPAPSVKNGEYDVDLVVLSATSDQSPNGALDDLLKTIESNGKYKKKVEKDNPKIPCIRLRYADEDKAKFHVDVVPAFRVDESSIKIPRRDEEWEISNPEEYTEWVLNQGIRFQKTIMFLRRWRDEHEIPIKSIALQVLTSQCLSREEQDARNFGSTIEAMFKLVDGYESPPDIYNPVLEEENLTERWSQEDFESFKTELDKALTTIAKIEGEIDHDLACEMWQKILGEDFVYKTDKEFLASDVVLSLADYSHAKTLSHYSIPNRPDKSVKIELKITMKLEDKKTRFSHKLLKEIPIKSIFFVRELVSGQIVNSGRELKLKTYVQGMKNRDFMIYWQVVNTGEEAQVDDDLRGEIFPSKNSRNKRSHTERTKYFGTHWIESYVVSSSVCVARSGRFYVRIKHPN